MSPGGARGERGGRPGWVPVLLLLLLPAFASGGDLDEAKKLLEAKKHAEAAELLEKAAAADEKDVEALKLLLGARIELKQWDAFTDALLRLAARGSDFENEAPFNRQILEWLGSVNWYATDPQKIAVFARLAKERPKSPWRVSWLSICMTSHARQKQFPEAETVEKELLALPLDGAGSYRVARAYLEASWRPEKALELMERAVDLRAAEPLPEEPLARETVLTELSVWRAYLAFAYRENGRMGRGNRFWEAEPETSGFTDATAEAGLGEARGGRVAVGDYDGDGWDDLSFGGIVWRNDKGVFRRAAAETGLPQEGAGGSLWGDADNDGDLDLWTFVANPGPRLYENRGGTFAELKDTGLEGALEAPPEGCGLGDLNGDGILDLYVAVYEGGDLGGGRVDRLFLSQGKGKWADALEAAGMGEEKAAPLCGRGVNMADFDGDGDLDVYVSNYRLQKNYLWRNEGGGKFVNAGKDLGVEGVAVTEQEWTAYGHTIGSCWADLDGDLDSDLVCANLAHPRFIKFSNKTQVLMNGGAGAGWRFADIFGWSGIPYEETHSDVSAADYDNDGDLDLYFTSVYRERPSWLVRNDGRAHFESVGWRSGTVTFNGWGHAWLDADNDGDLDLLVCEGGRARLFRNGVRDAAWLQLALRAKTCGAVGARVRAWCGDWQGLREVAAGRGTTSQDTARVHFGLGRRSGKAVVEVRWPGGKVRRLEGVELNRLVTVEEE